MSAAVSPVVVTISILVLAMLSASTAFCLPSNWSVRTSEAMRPTRIRRQAPAKQGGPPTVKSRIQLLSRNHHVGNKPGSFVTWGDRVSVSSYSELTTPFVVVDFYYRLNASDPTRHMLDLVCWQNNVCLYMDFALTLNHISIPFVDKTLTYTVHIGATVTYDGQQLENIEPDEQRLLVVGPKHTKKYNITIDVPKERIGHNYTQKTSDGIVVRSSVSSMLLSAAIAVCLSVFALML